MIINDRTRDRFVKGVIDEARYFLEESAFYTHDDDKIRFLRLAVKELREFVAMDTEAAAEQMADCLKEGLDVLDSIKALHAAKYDPDTVNKMLDDFGEKYNASPLEYNDNLHINRQDLIEYLRNLYKDEL